MLTEIAIRDFAIVDHLELELAAGLTAITGETGAGKSILLDALGLALGARAERGLVRHGAERAVVTAVFQPPDDHPVQAILDDAALAREGELVLRRSGPHHEIIANGVFLMDTRNGESERLVAVASGYRMSDFSTRVGSSQVFNLESP